ncbi:hypothetical protein ACFL2A_01685 [Thermodesulfobacteriota bacterium]
MIDETDYEYEYTQEADPASFTLSNEKFTEDIDITDEDVDDYDDGIKDVKIKTMSYKVTKSVGEAGITGKVDLYATVFEGATDPATSHIIVDKNSVATITITANQTMDKYEEVELITEGREYFEDLIFDERKARVWGEIFLYDANGNYCPTCTLDVEIQTEYDIEVTVNVFEYF